MRDLGRTGVESGAAGAILYFAVNAAVEGVNLSAMGVVLMVVGAIAILASLVNGGFRSFGRRTTERETFVVDERPRYQRQPRRP
ncbi:MAG: hypothetical protein S0880_33495 [Actinomycetota bacterium]|nr:hypothetical protein [Actinomycetota bacterium]